MHKQVVVLLLIMASLCFQTTFSQEKKVKDSARMYKRIQNYANKSRVGRYMHQLIFEQVSKNKRNPIKKPVARFGNTTNKIIRRINITTLDPFGYSDVDTTKTPQVWSERFGNRLHIKSTKANIRNILLFKENQVFDSILVKESERLMRLQSYISTVVISVSRPSVKHDSIDVNVRVLDSWSFIPTGSISKTGYSIFLDEKNIAGTGHTLEYERDSQDQFETAANRFLYVVPNFKNTFIKTSLLLRNDQFNNRLANLNFERPFFSPLTKYAAGYSVGREIRRDSLDNLQFQKTAQSLDVITQDFWVGRAFRVFDETFINAKATNLILSARVLHQKYLQQPDITFDPIRFFSDEVLILSGIGITKRIFVEDKLIFKNGIVEDVPLGVIYGITTGYQFKNNQTQFYFGSQAAYGDYFKFGYLSANLEFGSFYKDGISNQSSFVLQLNYFTNLYKYGKWKIRQFIKPQLVIGNNRLESLGDRLSLNNSYGIQNFDAQIFGTKKVIMTFQTQAYSPWVVAGFRLNPYFNYTAAMIGDGANGFGKSKLFSRLGIGLNINNDYLVFSSFQVSLSYYPSIPGVGENIFRTNGFQNSDFGFQSFELAKPRLAEYK